MSSDYCTGVAYSITANLNIIAEHGSELLNSCFYILSSIMDYNQRLIALYITCDTSGTHVAEISEYGITYIIIMRGLNVIKKDYVLKLNTVTDYAVSAHKR